MEEKVRFVWETTIGYEPVEARKEQKFGSMKARYERMQKRLKNLERIEELSKRAEEFGVLEVRYVYFNTREYVSFEEATVYISKGITDMLGMEFEENNRAISIDDYYNILEKLKEFQREQLNTMKEYLKEAEEYLTVEVKP